MSNDHHLVNDLTLLSAPVLAPRAIGPCCPILGLPIESWLHLSMRYVRSKASAWRPLVLFEPRPIASGRPNSLRLAKIAASGFSA